MLTLASKLSLLRWTLHSQDVECVKGELSTFTAQWKQTWRKFCHHRLNESVRQRHNFTGRCCFSFGFTKTNQLHLHLQHNCDCVVESQWCHEFIILQLVFATQSLLFPCLCQSWAGLRSIATWACALCSDCIRWRVDWLVVTLWLCVAAGSLHHLQITCSRRLMERKASHVLFVSNERTGPNPRTGGAPGSALSNQPTVV